MTGRPTLPAAEARPEVVPGHPLPDTRSDPLPPSIRAAVAAVTPARLFHAGSPVAYPTRDWLALRADHAAARDALYSRIDLADPSLASFVARHQPIEITSAAGSPAEYLARPDLGRRLSAGSRRALTGAGAAQIGLVLGDGLSATAAITQGPAMVDALTEGAALRGWTCGRPLVVHHCRVGLLNELGPLLGSDVVVLLIGERPGLAVADSLSAYLAYQPRPGHTDAERNLVSGIHDRGTPVELGAGRVLDLIALLLARQTSGVEIKEGSDRGPALGV